MTNNNAFIIGSGAHLPETIVTNEDLTGKLLIEPDHIFKSSGIRRRHWATEGQPTSALGIIALKQALEDAQIGARDVDYLLFGTMTPDRFVPGTSFAIQAGVGLNEVPCLDLRAACCNALYGLQIAKALISSGVARTVAICLAEIQSRYLDLRPDAAPVSMLFGDGAAAFIVSVEQSPGALEVQDIFLASDGSYVDDLGVRDPGTAFGSTESANFYPRMNGQSVILQASRRMVSAGQTILCRNQVPADEVRWVVPHQANANLLRQVSRGLNLVNAEMVSVIEECGNTSSASMGIALDNLRASNRVMDGDYVLMPAFAAGFTWGAALCRASGG